MNPLLDRLQPYPFEKLRALLAGVTPPTTCRPIRLSIGEPQHGTPKLVLDAIQESFSGLGIYPNTRGSDSLRQTIAGWLERRYHLPAVDSSSQILPVNGSREALFSFAQAILDPNKKDPLVVCPNPFYQIYEGAALLAGTQPVFLNQLPENNFGFDLDTLTPEQWSRVQLFYVCSPGNPTGRVLSIDEWRTLFELSDRYGFVIASDECYSEIYCNEEQPPLGGLEAAQQLGREGFPRLVMFSSLSKRSSVPGLRSGFVAGDADILSKYLKYRTYHGCAMSMTVQAASIAAWNDEIHVRENRRLYCEKFDTVTPVLQSVLELSRPDASFYLWARTPGEDTNFTRKLLEATGVTVLPGQYLAREAHGRNAGRGFVRIALVAPCEECLEAAQRIADYLK